MNVSQAKAIVGGLSNPSKIPTHGYSLPASRCNVGSKLRELENSTCWDCYAYKGRYVFPNVQRALELRYQKVKQGKVWADAMIFLILWYCTKTKIFRWHDSGDLIDLIHLEWIVYIAECTPDITHWLPTREVKIVQQFKKERGEFPPNLIVRISATMINGMPHKFHEHSSTVVTDKSLAIDKVCPSSEQENQCKDCRMCWDKNVKDIAYIKH
jgi:hypothetical protein|tara:strand:- start:46 stop:681 length:636 start_codon:yes stop_codon:yes gene_type:complete